MAAILRGKIYRADLNPLRGVEQAGLRPVLIISHEIVNERSGTVIALALTGRKPLAGFPLTLFTLGRERNDYVRGCDPSQSL